MKKYIVIIILTVCCAACNKDLDGYKNDPRINFYEQVPGITTDRVMLKSYSFVTDSPNITMDTMLVQARIMGLPAGKDRFFAAVPDKGGNATPGKDYKILPGLIKANEITGYLPVVIFRTPEIKSLVKVLHLKIADSNDFKAGVGEDALITLNWSDDLIKPDNWDGQPGLNNYFGSYSRVKYKFIIDVLGTSQWNLQQYGVDDPTALTYYSMMDQAAIVKDALVQYNNTHTPPLTDETGQIVSLP